MAMNIEDEKTLVKILNFIRAASMLLLALHLYWACFRLFKEYGLTNHTVVATLVKVNRSTGLFSNILVAKLTVIGLLVISCLGAKGKKDQKITANMVLTRVLLGLAIYFLNFFLLYPKAAFTDVMYILTTITGYVLVLSACILFTRLLKTNLLKDVFNVENESFMQETRLIENQYSVNLPTKFYYQGKWQDGKINVINPFRASFVLGTPGSGKTFSIVEPYMRQQIEKGFSMYVYDYKFPALSNIAYNHYRLNSNGYKVKPKVYVINFDNPKKSHRCNPIHPDFMTDISDAYESAYTIMLNLNKSWIQKQGDFFVESPITLLAAIIWFLKIYENGKYCTFPHTIEFLNKKYAEIFPILMSYPELENYLSAFMDAWEGDAQDQLQGQIASAKIPLSRLSSPSIYWVMSGNDFSLDINNPEEPKILCIGNNPKREKINSAALGLYNSRIVQLINQPDKLKSSVIIDELPTIYFRGIDRLIGTARSNLVAVLLGFQDYSQLTLDYGDKESKVIQNTVGNIFSGQARGDTAKTLSEIFGQNVQQRESISINRQDTSTSISTQMGNLIPASKIANLSQGQFVGTIADEFGQEIELKTFNAKILVDIAKIKEDKKKYVQMPVINPFLDDNGKDCMKEVIQSNFNTIKQDVLNIISSELNRIKNDPELGHLVKE